MEEAAAAQRPLPSARHQVADALADVGAQRLIMIGTAALDALFVILTALFNLGTTKLLETINLEGLDFLVVRTLQWLLAMSTVGLAALALLRDLLIAASRLWERR